MPTIPKQSVSPSPKPPLAKGGPSSQSPKPSTNGGGLKPGQKPSAPPATPTPPVSTPAVTKPGKLKKPKPVKESKEVLYPRIETRVFVRDTAKAPLGTGGKPSPASFNADVAMELIGWQTEEMYKTALAEQYTAAELKNLDTSFGDDYLFKDRLGKKIRCGNNLHNRPFYPLTAEDWMLEILRQKWRFNGESMVVDKFGGCQDIQHRAVGLIWAKQEWELDRLLPKPQQKWQKFWPTEPMIDCIVVFGIEATDDVVNTINTGKPRTLADALYRSEWFAGKSPPERNKLSKLTSAALSYLRNRTAARLASLAPRFPHSESFEYLDSHKKLLECVKFISEEDSERKSVAIYLSHGYAAALLYLMGSARSEADKYAANGTEKVLDWGLYDKAQEFWVLFCNNAPALEPLREELERLPIEITHSSYRVALFIKAWNLFSDGKKLTQEAIALQLGTDPDTTLPVLNEHPRIGGIDVDYEEEGVERTTTDEEAESLDDKSLRGICPKTEGEHEWVTEKDDKTGQMETYCKHCLDPKPGPKRSK